MSGGVLERSCSGASQCRRSGLPCLYLAPGSQLAPAQAKVTAAFPGVKNIHAYSWLAHSRKYLESVERERRHSLAAKVNKSSIQKLILKGLK